MQIRLVPISGDKEGILPDVLENHCRLQQLNGIYLVPNYHNPTGHIMRQSRKEALAAIIRKYQLLAIEDDIYGFLLENHPCLWHISHRITPFIFAACQNPSVPVCALPI